MLSASITIATLYCGLIFFSDQYILGLYSRFWGYYPRGGFWMALYALWTAMVVTRNIYTLNRGAKKAGADLNQSDYQHFKYYAISITIFMFAAIDFIPKFGPVIYPIGYVFVAAFSSIVTYAIVRHKLLNIDLFIKRGFVYSMLISLITFIYLATVVVSEYFFRSYMGYTSILVAILASIVISIAFNPLRKALTRFTEKYFFGKNIEELSIENLAMRLELQKQEKLKAISTLAAGMAHEIRNPLTTIRTFADYLPEKYDDPEFRKTFHRLVVDEVDRVNNIVKQLLDFSKQREPLLKPVEITDVLDDTLELLSANLLNAKIQVEKRYECSGTVLADMHQMKQVFLNLTLNSIQSMPASGTLSLCVKLTDNKRVAITISDTGQGIPPDELSRVFDPFFTTKDSGTGLGLSIVHGIIQSHEGSIDIQSHVGRGTSVTISLPTEF